MNIQFADFQSLAAADAHATSRLDVLESVVQALPSLVPRFVDVIAVGSYGRGEAEHMASVRMRFDEIEGQLVYVIDVEPAPIPAFVKTQRGREFLIRVGSTSPPLDSEAAMKYVRSHWKN